MSEQHPNPTALIVGRGAAQARAALDLARAGAQVTLLTSHEGLTPGTEGLAGVPPLLEAARHPRIKLLTGATIEAVENGGASLRVTADQAPRYVDPARCTACGACVEVCPVSVPGDRRAIYREGVPTAYAIDKAGMAPCRHACPIDQRAQGYVALIREGDFQAAYHTIKQDNPFPSVCGRVCNHRCEEACTRCEIDEPVAVMALKRFVTDWAWERKQAEALVEARERVTLAPRSGLRVAIVGAGPAGLSAARELNRLGHAVTVLEALPVPGGMMRVGIPSFRLDRRRLAWDVDEILAEGVELRTNHPVEDVEHLFDQGYDAVLLAVGLHASRTLSIPGAEGPGVEGAVEFLRRVNLGERPDWRGRRVIVVGGGSTAMDTARFCRRLGAEVTVVYRRSRAEMPAHDFEVEDAEREGVTLRLLTNPSRVLREGGQVVGVTCLQMALGEPDESGRRRPIPVEGSEFTLPADVLLLAIGQDSDLSLLPQDGTVAARRGVVQHDPETLMTGRPGLFVAGDVAGTDGFVVDAIATGMKAARSVDRYLRAGEGAVEPLGPPPVRLDERQIARRLSWAAPRGESRARTRSTLPETLLGDFGETEFGLSEAEALAEAARCLNCGLCSECLACVRACPAAAIDHRQLAQELELQADALIWADGASRLGAGDPGVFVVGDDTPLPSAVDRALSHLGLARAAPALSDTDVAAPSRRSGMGDASRSTQHGLFLCRCGGEIEQVVDLAAVGARIEDLPGVTWVRQVDFACHPEGNAMIRAAMAEQGLDGAVLAACSCCALDQICYSCTTQRIRCKERLGVWDGLKGLSLQFVNLREQCAFVHRDDPDAATRKAGDLVAASLAALSMAGERAASPEPRLPITARVDPVRCRGCEDCEFACGLDAIHVVGASKGNSTEARLARVDVTRCLGCGVCMAACSSGAIRAGDTGDAQAEAMLAAMGDLSDKTVVFSCNWGAYSAVEAAGVGRLAYDPSVRLIRLMCAGRAHEGLLLKAFAQGAARVLVLACGHEGGKSASQRVSESASRRRGESLCHYYTGNDQARRSVEQTQQLLALLGIDRTRLKLAELDPGDGPGFVETISRSRITHHESRITDHKQ